MAINPELITTIRVDQLPDEALSLTNLFPHTVGTELKSATIQELVDLVATSIGVSGGVGYIALSVTDGQQLPDVPELPSFFLCGAGTFLNINGYSDIICTENLNAIMSLTDHWELAVEIPINPLSGTVQSVTGSAVDNTDPLNPVINEIIFGVQNIVAGTNITVDNTDPANPIVSATGGAGSPTLQEVLEEGDNATINGVGDLSIIYADGTLSSEIYQDKNVASITSSTDTDNISLIADTDTNIFLTKSSVSTDLKIRVEEPTGVAGEIIIKDPVSETETVAFLSDITAPTLQDVTDEGATTTNGIETGNIIATDVNNGEPVLTLNYDTDLISTIAVFTDANTGFSHHIDNSILTETRYLALPDASGTIALTSDIPTTSGIPHATASGTDTYTATVTGVAAYNDADAYLIRFTNGNTTGATLNINALGAKTLYRNNDGALIGGDIINGGEMLCIYNTSLNGFQVIGTAPNSLFAYVTNDDSVTLTKGMPVYAFSGTGDRMTVKRANNSSDATSAQTVGLVLSTSIAAGQKGLIMMQGLLDGLSILPTATFADGDAVYLGATAGTITNVKPYAPNHLVYLGVVTTASNGSAGRMYVRVQNGYELSEIHDIDLISNAPTNNQALTYESSTDLWKNKTIIEDSITDGVTDKAPSQNAVFDALALKPDELQVVLLSQVFS